MHVRIVDTCARKQLARHAYSSVTEIVADEGEGGGSKPGKSPSVTEALGVQVVVKEMS